MRAQEHVALAYVAAHPDEAALVMERSPRDAAAVLATLKPAVAARVFGAMGPAPAAASAAAMPDAALASIVAALPVDAAAVSLRRIETTRRDALLALLPGERAETLRAMLAWPDDSAGLVADPLVLSLADDITVAEGQRRLRGSKLHLFYYVYLVSREGMLTGVLALPELMAARRDALLRDVMHADPVSIEARTSLATVVALPAWRDYDALPVVDPARRLVGAIRHKALRRLDWHSHRAVTATLVGLSELYWNGLSAIVSSIGESRSTDVT